MERYYIVRQPNPPQNEERFETLADACDAAARKINGNNQHVTAVVYQAVCLVAKKVEVPPVDIVYFTA